MINLISQKQVAYNQIKFQDEKKSKLNSQISQMLEKELFFQIQEVEYERKFDNKEVQLKELNKSRNLQEVKDATVIAELRQRVESLEVQIQELVNTRVLNDSDKNIFNAIATSNENLIDFNENVNIKF